MIQLLNKIKADIKADAEEAEAYINNTVASARRKLASMYEAGLASIEAAEGSLRDKLIAAFNLGQFSANPSSTSNPPSQQPQQQEVTTEKERDQTVE